MSTKKHSVLMAQANYHYGKNVFIPYSVGSLQAYAQTFPEICESFRFQRPLFLRTNPDKIIENRKEPAVACLSSYLWNCEYNKELAKKLRAAYPNCLIIMGGTQVPNASQNFFAEHPYVDLQRNLQSETYQPEYTAIYTKKIKYETYKNQNHRHGEIWDTPVPDSH